MNFKTYIYALEDPYTNVIKYIGKSDNPVSRLNVHLKRFQKNTPKNAWLRSLDIPPNILILDEVEINEWCFWEKYWISQFKTWGFKLKNSTNGGDGGSTVKGRKFGPLSKEIKQKISQKTKEGMNSEIVKAKCRLGSAITKLKILDCFGKLRPDIIEKKREASKKKVAIIDNFENVLKLYISIEDFLNNENISYYLFMKNRIKNNVTSEINNKNKIHYFWKNTYKDYK